MQPSGAAVTAVAFEQRIDSIIIEDLALRTIGQVKATRGIAYARADAYIRQGVLELLFEPTDDELA